MIAPLAGDPALLAEIQALRGQVAALTAALGAALGARTRVTLTAAQAQPFLGQALSITATVTGWDDGQPRPGVPVTLATSWGMLVPAAAEQAPGGSNLVLRTGLDGACQALFLPPVQEALLVGQQDALEAALAGLDPNAATPRDLTAALQELARQYRWEVNGNLRRALDIYFQSFHLDNTNRVNAHDYLAEWSYFTATVTAYAQDGSGGTVSGQAALALACKDWLAPWFQVYTALTKQAGALDQNLSEATLANLDPGPLLDAVYGRLHEFVGRQRGLAGEYAARSITQDALQNFAATGLAQLPLETRVGVVPALLTSSGVVSQSGTSVIAALGEARAGLRDQVQATASDLGDRLAGKLDAAGLETALGNSATVTGLRSGIAGKLDAAGLETALGGSATIGGLRSGLAGKLDAAGLDGALANSPAFGKKLDAAGLETALGGSATFGKLQTAIAAKLDASGLETALANSPAFGKKVDAAGLETALGGSAAFGKLQTAIAAKLDASGLDAALANSPAFGKKLDAAGLETALGGSATFGKLQTAIAAKLDASGLDAALANSATIGTLRSTLASKLDTATLDDALNRSAVIKRIQEQRRLPLTVADLDPVLQNSTVIAGLQTGLAAKADAGALTELQTAVQAKADASAVTALQSAVQAKADASALTALQTNLTTAINSKVDIARVQNIESDLGNVKNDVRIFRRGGGGPNP